MCGVECLVSHVSVSVGRVYHVSACFLCIMYLCLLCVFSTRGGQRDKTTQGLRGHALSHLSFCCVWSLFMMSISFLEKFYTVFGQLSSAFSSCLMVTLGAALRALCLNLLTYFPLTSSLNVSSLLLAPFSLRPYRARPIALSLRVIEQIRHHAICESRQVIVFKQCSGKLVSHCQTNEMTCHTNKHRVVNSLPCTCCPKSALFSRLPPWLFPRSVIVRYG